jgi:ankyrin repeat protein
MQEGVSVVCVSCLAHSVHAHLHQPRISRSIPPSSFLLDAKYAEFADAITQHDCDRVAALLAGLCVDDIPIDHLVDECGFSTVHLAVQANCSDIVRLLLRAGADVDAKEETDLNGSTPAHLAADMGSSACLVALIDGGASLQQEDHYESTPLLRAVRLDRTDCVDVLLTLPARRIGPDNGDRHGRTGCHFALQNRNFSLFQRLLPICSRPFGFLHSLVNVDMAQLLVAHGYGVNETNASEKTPLHCAAAAGCVAMIRFLVGHGADIDADAHGVTPILEAVRQGHVEAVEWLLAFGCSTESKRGITFPANVGAELAALLVAGGASSLSSSTNVVPPGINIDTANRRINSHRAEIVRTRVVVICCALQSAQLPALVSMCIVDADSPITASLSFHLKWKMITTVKHYS